jgi:ribonuclease Z
MQVTFLGTSSGTPSKTRNVSATVIQKHNAKNWSLIDCGEGTQHQILHSNLSLNCLDAIYITHVHGDHCYGLIGLLASANMAKRVETLKIIAPLAIKAWIEASQSATSLNLSFEIEFIALETLSHTLECQDFEIESIALSHRLPSWGFIFTECHLQVKLNAPKLEADNISKGKIWGQIQTQAFVRLENNQVIESKDYHLAQRRARRIAISGDNDSPSLYAKIKNIDVLVHESTYTEEISLRVGKSPQHSSAQDVALFAKDYGLKNLILTHFSPRYQDDRSKTPSIQDIEDEAKKFYNNTLFLANDFDVFILDKKGCLKR